MPGKRLYGINTKEDLAILHDGNCYEQMMKLGLPEWKVDKIIRDYEAIAENHLEEIPSLRDGRNPSVDRRPT